MHAWWQWWMETGKWQDRGRGYGYCMARILDEGPYAPDNVYLATGQENSSDYQQLTRPLRDKLTA